MTITEFLLARIAEDERRLDLPYFMEEDSAHGDGWGNRDDCPVCGKPQFSGNESVTEDAWWEHAEGVHGRSRVLAECRAKRAIVEHHRPEAYMDVPEESCCRVCHEGIGGDHPCPTLRALASIYADHPDFDPAWAPAESEAGR